MLHWFGLSITSSHIITNSAWLKLELLELPNISDRIWIEYRRHYRTLRTELRTPSPIMYRRTLYLTFSWVRSQLMSADFFCLIRKSIPSESIVLKRDYFTIFDALFLKCTILFDTRTFSGTFQNLDRCK